MALAPPPPVIEEGAQMLAAPDQMWFGAAKGLQIRVTRTLM